MLTGQTMHSLAKGQPAKDEGNVTNHVICHMLLHIYNKIAN
jgi:hypothetical protein